MQSLFMKKFVSPLLTGLLVVFTAAACDGPLDPEEHPEAGGVVILQRGTNTVLARSVGARAAFDKPLQLRVGQAAEVEVKFLDSDNPNDLSRAFLPDETEGESLVLTVANPAIAAFDFHGDHGDFEGLAPGTTTATVQLFHGGHSDFDSGTLTINVTQ
ncbi:MAG: hypothetical protein H0U67_03985 [Gemmatimonadetes bacterium]|nr:hypothetical protein [Gemmatimonadota bacterium]